VSNAHSVCRHASPAWLTSKNRWIEAHPIRDSFLDQARALFLQQTGDSVAAQQLAWQAVENLRQQQASALAYFDVFWLSAVVPLVLVALVLLMKRSVAEKRGNIGGE
jgi:DHA2 family multidrug resistance protein